MSQRSAAGQRQSIKQISIPLLFQPFGGQGKSKLPIAQPRRAGLASVEMEHAGEHGFPWPEYRLQT